MVTFSSFCRQPSCHGCRCSRFAMGLFFFQLACVPLRHLGSASSLPESTEACQEAEVGGSLLQVQQLASKLAEFPTEKLEEAKDRVSHVQVAVPDNVSQQQKPPSNSSGAPISFFSLGRVHQTPLPPEQREAEKTSAMGGALGMPHEGVGLDEEVPMTVSEESVKGNAGLVSVHSMACAIILPASAIFLLIILISRLFGRSKYLNFMPDSVNIIMASMMLGVGVRKMIQWGYIDFHQFTLINSVVLNLFLLPIIIFNSGWSLNKRNFVSQIEHIHIFAVFGTLISTFIVGGLSYILATKGWHKVTDFRSNLVFGALISAVDPVATLATYAKLGLPESQPLLHTLVFGESAINDAVAIVIFDVVNEGWDDLSLVKSTGQIAKLLFGSLFVGVFVAGLMMFLMKKARLKGDTHHEILYLHMSAYCIFAIAESVHLSGIIAGLFGGMFFGTYGPCLLSKEGNDLATEFLEISGMSADTWVFILCGVSSALLNKQDGVLFGMIGVILCLLARGVSVPSCAMVCNFLKRNKFGEGRTQEITPAHQIMMWHGGLRGGIALVLALEVDATWCAFKGAILNGTFLIICVLLLMLGSTTELLLKKVGLQGEDGDDAKSQAPQLELWSEDFYAARVCAAIDPLVRPILVGHDEPHRK